MSTPRTFRVRGRDIKTREAVAIDAMEGRDADDVTARLNLAGIEVLSVEETARPTAAGAFAAHWRAERRRSEEHEQALRRARQAEAEALRHPRQRVLADLTFSAQLNIAVAVFLGAVVAAMVIGVCGGALSAVAWVPERADAPAIRGHARDAGR